MANCDYLIGVESTFALWASFYGKVPYFSIRDKDQKITQNSFKIGKY